MNRLYETKISDKRWYLYDILGNVGWIAYIVCVILGFIKHGEYWAINIIGIVPAVFMLIGIAELISERVAKLDRILPFTRLLRGFGALTLGGNKKYIFIVVGLMIVGTLESGARSVRIRTENFIKIRCWYLTIKLKSAILYKLGRNDYGIELVEEHIDARLTVDPVPL